ncbi:MULTISPECIES: ABC transporter ATP-binding protein [Prochlorococcus]|uniref:ATPase components of ABC transporters n=1 Tax=Prochlorococcus marinus (strain SARG / CCMP1375 / SS120) TaxID=167539 RepID=Q7VEA8_PROMA|nr:MULTISPECIES: ABC-F family ATP-binding cassette domain-containing protein [Prochlorococcus]AAP99151.1 ATPase components of ABC transporters [Prochlorococcus marinus subsp. marinus str. CCMP1375]
MIRLEKVSKIYPTAEVLKEITWEIKPSQRIGLVGVNGAGKSTQLRIIAGLEEVSSGEVLYEGQPRIAYLQQEFDVDVNRTLREELFQAFADAAEVLIEINKIEQQMNSEKAKSDDQFLNSLIKQLGTLQMRFEALHGYELEAQIEKLLPQIGFFSDDAERLVGDFSGGWQMRVALGKILLQEPDLLLLDEPTNHLDLETIEWLEKYLLKQTAAMVIISHDRSFLDRICTNIVSTERGISRTYNGNYSDYLNQKELESESIKAAFDRQQKELTAQQDYIERFRASATRSTQAKSREKLLNKLDKIEAPISELKKPNFSFPKAPRSGKSVVRVDDLTHTYNDKIIFLGAKLHIETGDHIAILGPNGAGKSTLLRLIIGKEKAEDGLVELGRHNVIPSYFEQNQSEALELSKTVLDTLFDVVPDWSNTKVRSLLGSLGFSNDDVFKKVADLSGGEKARVALALIIVKPCNLLLLDEPTNHLDIPAKEMLEEAIKNYEGSLVVVSHDRYFISKVANRIVEIRDGQLIFYSGNYDYYKDKKRQQIEKEKALLDEAKKEAKRIAKRKLQRKSKKK